MRAVGYLIALTLIPVGFIPFRQPPENEFDILILNGTIYDGDGNPPVIADIGIRRDTIAAIGDLGNSGAKERIDAGGLAVSPGFINMLSWADRSLLADGRSMSDIRQGVTLEVFGEGFSPGPQKRPGHRPVDSLWTSLGGYFRWLMKKGVSPNVASFVGATSVRMHELDQDNRSPSSTELRRMENLVKEAMEQGAMGLGSSLIYAPASYARTPELIALAKVAARYGGMYITHIRSEGDFILEGLDEAIRISKAANLPVEIYHLKINIERNWSKIDRVLQKIDSARKAGLRITANVYPYTASATGLTSRLPVWVQEGGAKEMRKRLRSPVIRRRVLREMEQGIPYKNSDPKYVALTAFRLDSLNRRYKGKRLDEIARLHGKTADETTVDLIIEDRSRIECIYYLQSEDNLRRIMQQPYVSVGSDAGSFAPTLMFDQWDTHPRAYGTFARVLGKYARDEKIFPLEEAVRRMTSLPASNLGIVKRGRLKPGFFADIAVFDAQNIRDMATYENPAQYATGVMHVIVNGVSVISNGVHTHAKPGRIIYGPGFAGRHPSIVR